MSTIVAHHPLLFSEVLEIIKVLYINPGYKDGFNLFYL